MIHNKVKHHLDKTMTRQDIKQIDRLMIEVVNKSEKIEELSKDITSLLIDINLLIDEGCKQ